jgi:putative ABC transport system permease protein
VLGDGTRLAMAGIAVGAFAATWCTQVISGMLYNVKPDDPSSFASAAFVLFLVALLASYLPAHRASRVDPISALRQD